MLKGRARNIGDGKPDGVVRIEGRLSEPNGLSLDQHLDQATFTVTKLLSEVSGSGELSRTAGHARHLPITLQASAASRPDHAGYETAAGATPQVKVELSRGPAKSLLVFSIVVDNAEIDRPSACGGRSSGGVPVETSIDIHNGSQLLRVDTTGARRRIAMATNCDPREHDTLSAKLMRAGPGRQIDWPCPGSVGADARLGCSVRHMVLTAAEKSSC